MYRLIVGKISQERELTDRDRSDIMALVQDRFATRKAPDVIAEATVFLPHLLIAPSIVDHGVYFTRRADHAVSIQDALHICIVIVGDLVKVKVIETLPEDFPLLQHQIPA